MHKAVILAFVVGFSGGVAHAYDYKPVVCTATKPYAGAPRFDALPSFAALPVLPEGEVPAALAAKLSDTFAKAKGLTKAASLGAAVSSPEGQWHQADSPRLYYWASAGKTFTAIAVLQAVEARKLRLDDRVSK